MNYDRILVELLNRVSTLEEDVEKLKGVQPEAPFVPPRIERSPQKSRDKTKFLFNNELFGKNRLVLAVVSSYVHAHPNITANELMIVFPKNLQGSLGVVRLLSEAKASYIDCAKRFFCCPEEIIHTQTEDCVVCSQWTSSNIGQFVNHTSSLGMHISNL